MRNRCKKWRKASITIGTIPTIILAFPVWRFMVRGLTSGAIKG